MIAPHGLSVQQQLEPVDSSEQLSSAGDVPSVVHDMQLMSASRNQEHTAVLARRVSGCLLDRLLSKWTPKRIAKVSNEMTSFAE